MARVKMIFDTETAKAVQGFLKIEDRQKALERRSAELARKSASTANQASQGNTKWASSVGGVVTSYVGLAGAVGLAAKALAALNEAKAAGAQGVTGREFGFGSLAQISGGDKARFEALKAQSLAFAASGGVGESQAIGTVMQMQSLGMGAQIPMAAKLARYGIVKQPLEAVMGITRVKQAFGTAEAGTPQQILNKLAVASARSETTIGQYGGAMARVAADAAAAGLSDEETMAGLNAMIAARGRELGPAALRQFINATQRKGITGSLLDRVKTIQGRGWTGPRLVTQLGTAEGAAAYMNLLQARGDIKASTSAIRAGQAATGTADSPIMRILRLAAGDPEMAASGALRRARAVGAATQATEYGVDKLNSQVAAQRLVDAIRRQPRPAILNEMAVIGTRLQEKLEFSAGWFEAQTAAIQKGQPSLRVEDRTADALQFRLIVEKAPNPEATRMLDAE